MGLCGGILAQREQMSLIAFLSPLAGATLGLIHLLERTTLHKIASIVLMTIFLLSPLGANIPFLKPTVSIIDMFREKETKKNLKNIREAICVYYKENGNYPSKLDEKMKLYVFLPRKLNHPATNTLYVISIKPNEKIKPDQITDEGGWIYSPDSGDIRINCSHKDSKGVYYYEW
ncbi:MAG: hypothetical protein AB1595_01210 [bacterium]